MITWTNKAGEITKVEGVGCTISTGWDQPQIMSDVWDHQTFALIWDGSKPVRVTLTSYECDLPEKATVVIDATPEVLAAVQAYKDAEEAQRQEWERQRRLVSARILWDTVEKGKRMVVVKGRKVPLGTTGIVFWTGPDGYRGTRVGLAVTDARDERGFYKDVVWTTASNLENAEPFNPKF